MQRGMNAATLAEIQKEKCRTFILIRFGFSAPEYITDAHKNVDYGGSTYLAGGNLISIDSIKESNELAINSVSIEVSGFNLANVAIALNEEDYTNGQVDIYRGFFDASYNLIADPVSIFPRGKIIKFDFTEDFSGNSASLKWTVANHWADWDKISGRRTNHADQQLYYPGDLGFEYSQVVNVDPLLWGRKS